MPKLLLFHIGPVQSFITSARRSRDLWFGSWLLSDLSKAAAYAIADRHGIGSLVFPAPVTLEDLLPNSGLIVANKILAYIDGDLGKTPQQVEGEVRCRLAQVAGAAFDIVASNKGNKYFNRVVAEAQIADLPEIYWVALPCDDRSEFRRQRDRLEALMAARKNTRPFKQPDAWAAQIPKSSLDGLRESVIDEALYERAAGASEAGLLNSERLYRLFKARRAERLSGVDLMKRLGNPATATPFPSTSHVAALPAITRLRRLAQEERRVLDWAKTYTLTLKTYVSAEFVEPLSGRFAVPELNGHDGSILYESRLCEDDKLTGEGLKAVRNALSTFLQDSLGAGVAPSPYYMLLQGDGDRMGGAIDALADPDAQREFSLVLSKFSTEVRRVIEDEFGGALVYAGGDDVLAFLPLDTGLACAYTVAELFREMLARFADTPASSPTFSAGLVIAHHLDLLGQTMALARSAEQAAKAVEGKDALAITLSKRSGADSTVAGHWNTLVPRLEALINLVLADKVPAGAAYDLRDLAIRLDAANDEHLLKIQEIEIERILQRKHGQQGTQPLRGDATIGDLLEHTRPLEKDSALRFAETLIIADVLADAQRLSGVTPAELTAWHHAAIQRARKPQNEMEREGAA